MNHTSSSLIAYARQLESQLQTLSTSVQIALEQHLAHARENTDEAVPLQTLEKLSGLLGKQLQHFEKWLDLSKEISSLADEETATSHLQLGDESIDWEMLKRFMEKREATQEVKA